MLTMTRSPLIRPRSACGSSKDPRIQRTELPCNFRWNNAPVPDRIRIVDILSTRKFFKEIKFDVI